MGDLANLSAGGIFAILIIRSVLDFLKSREKAQAYREGMNGHSKPAEERHAEAMDEIAKQSVIQTELLREIHEQSQENGRILNRVDAKLETYLN